MVDRVPAYPGRVRLTPVSGQTNVYDLEMADSPSVVGTPINKANLLTDVTAAGFNTLFGSTPDTVNDALNALATGSLAKFMVGSYVGTGEYGADHPNSIDFGFVPKLIIFIGYKTGNTFSGFANPAMNDPTAKPSYHSLWLFDPRLVSSDYQSGLSPCLKDYTTSIGGSYLTVVTAYCKLVGSVLSWYVTQTTEDSGSIWTDPSYTDQLNISGTTYYYAALG